MTPTLTEPSQIAEVVNVIRKAAKIPPRVPITPRFPAGRGPGDRLPRPGRTDPPDFRIILTLSSRRMLCQTYAGSPTWRLTWPGEGIRPALEGAVAADDLRSADDLTRVVA